MLSQIFKLSIYSLVIKVHVTELLFRNLLKHEETILFTIIVNQTKPFQEKWNESLSNISTSLMNVFIFVSKMWVRGNSMQSFESNYKFSELYLSKKRIFYNQCRKKHRQFQDIVTCSKGIITGVTNTLG